jgi:ATP/maltotriose-dependent transcriptional regulator MalT
MSWEELYPTINEQAYYAVFRYDPRRKDKIQELVCQSYEKYLNDIAAGKEIKKQNFKCFVTRRAREVDQRSFCKKGSGGTSTIDALSFYRRRPDVETEIVEFDDRMIAKNRKKDAIEDAIAFQIDFQNWKNKLTRTELNILQLLLAGYKELKITELLKLSYSTVKENIKRIQQAYQEYFCREVLTTP